MYGQPPSYCQLAHRVLNGVVVVVDVPFNAVSVYFKGVGAAKPLSIVVPGAGLRTAGRVRKCPVQVTGARKSEASAGSCVEHRRAMQVVLRCANGRGAHHRRPRKKGF